MDPAKKRKIRLVVALSAAVLLATGLVYTSFSASTEAREPSEVLASGTDETYDLTGKVIPGTIERTDIGDALRHLRPRRPTPGVPVTYTGTVPDPFRDGREVIVTGKLEEGTFVAEHDSLITKCPSKFAGRGRGRSRARDHRRVIAETALGLPRLRRARRRAVVALFAAGARDPCGPAAATAAGSTPRGAPSTRCRAAPVCVVVLEAAFLRDDFSFEVVAAHSSTTTPTFYKLVALWSSQEGSLLLWAFVLSLASSAVLFLTRRRHREIVPWATAVLMALGAFFIALMLFEANPFGGLDPAPVEGGGLTPLLRHSAMAIHPPMLYTGYVPSRSRSRSRSGR